MSYETHEPPPCVMIPIGALAEVTGLTRAEVKGWATDPSGCPPEIDAWVGGFAATCTETLQPDVGLLDYARRNRPPVKLTAWMVSSVDKHFKPVLIEAQSSRAAAEIALLRHMDTVGKGEPITKLLWGKARKLAGRTETFRVTLCKDAEWGQSELVGWTTVRVGPPPESM